MQQKRNPSEQLKQFLDFIDESRRIYNLALEGTQTEERRQTDILHEIEFAVNSKERNKAATKLGKCRKDRRTHKDTAKRYEMVVNFFSDSQNQKVINQMRQLLGRQRK